MRLIDADALMKEYAEFVKESNNSDFADVPTWNDAVSLLGSAPTVKAIPIEWIEKEMKRLDEDIKWAWYYGNVALDKMDYLKMWLTLKLEDWEKENDRNQT